MKRVPEKGSSSLDDAGECRRDGVRSPVEGRRSRVKAHAGPGTLRQEVCDE